MTPSLARLLYECSPFNAFWSAFLVGFVVIGTDGCVYRTESGDEYLRGIE